MGSNSALEATPAFAVKRIAIIGAGPSGLAVAKYLLAENSFDVVDIYEQQSEVGGVWNYSPTLDSSFSLPQITPHVPPQGPVYTGEVNIPFFPNAMYEQLNTNIPKDLMQFSDKAFPRDSLIFPVRQDVQKYLIEYSQEIRQRIRFCSQVQDIKPLSVNGQDCWDLISKPMHGGGESRQTYDAIVVANGHYSVPYVPTVQGMEAFNTAYPSTITHSKNYRSRTRFAGQKVIVIGDGPSALDIGTQISHVCKEPLLNSIRTPSTSQREGDIKERVPPITEYIVEEKSVRFEDGRIEKNIDAIVYCTGYLYSYPFLKSLHKPVVTNGSRVLETYRQLFHINCPTIAFTALPQKIIPFPISEAQGAVLAKVWSNKIALPIQQEMRSSESQRIKESGDGKSFHILGYPDDASYINSLHAWVESAQTKVGKEPPYWGEKQLLMRQKYLEIRARFIELGGLANSLLELGFDFES